MARDTTGQGAMGRTGGDDDAPAGAAGRGTEHGLGGRLRQLVRSITGRDLRTASPGENERRDEAGPGGSDGHGRRGGPG